MAERVAAERAAEDATCELKASRDVTLCLLEALKDRLSAGEATAKRAADDRGVAEKELKKLKRSSDFDLR